MKKIYLVSLCTFCFFLLKAQTHVYQFGGNLIETSGNGPSLNEVLSCSAAAGSYPSQILTTAGGTCGTTAQQVFAFNEGGGLSYPNTGFINGSYTIHLFFEFNSLAGYQRIIDFKNSTTDRGMYILSDCLNFYPNGNVGTCPFFLPNTYYLISIVRDAATNLVNVYVNGNLFVTDYNDAAGDYLPTTNTTPIIFFRDDNAVTCEDRDGTVKYISLQATTSTASQILSVFTNICALVLPLDLTSFKATPAAGNNKTLLTWKTENEINTHLFLVERSSDGIGFETVGQVDAAGSGKNTYQFLDQMPGNSKLYYYRLKILDKDQQFKYSDVRRVGADLNKVLTVFPNPAANMLSISSYKNEVVVVTNSMGQLVQTIKLVQGNNQVAVAGWAPGLYFIKSEQGTTRFVKK